MSIFSSMCLYFIFYISFIQWMLKQIPLALLFPIWKAIDSNFLGMGRLRHAEFNHQAGMI